MSRVLDEASRREYPFPHMDSPNTASSSGSSSQPSRSGSSGLSRTRSSASSALSQTPLRRTARVERDRDSHESILPGATSKLFSHLMPRDHHDSRSLRTALGVMTERMENEKRRADDAERRVLEVLRKLRGAHEATMLAQAEASRAKEELTLYKYRLEDAQREITRANELIGELEQQKLEAEAEAARARSTARRYREQQLVERARQEGREQGYLEGLNQGKEIGYQEATEEEEPRERTYAMPTVEEVPDEEEPPRIVPGQYRSHTPGPAEIRVRTPAPEYRSQTPGLSTLSNGRVTPPPRRSPSRHACRNAGAASRPRSLDNGESVFAPIPIHEPAPSPVHPPVDIPPDGYIPYADREEQIYLPPPHELSRPITPAEPPPAPAPVMHPVQPSQASTSSAPDPDARGRIYAYSSSSVPSEGVPRTRSSASKPMSPQSKASTTISQFDLVGAPRGNLRVSTSGRARDGDRQVGSPRGPRPREDLPAPVRPPPPERQNSAGRLSVRQEAPASPMSPIEKLFKRRYRNKSSRDRERDRDTPPVMPPHLIPDIIIESPSTPSTSRSSAKTTITHPHFLSPEQHNIQALPTAPSTDNIIVMRTEIPGYPPTVPADQWMPPFTDSPMVPLSTGQFPPGFVPLTPPIQSGPFSTANPIPVPSNAPIPIPSNPIIPVPSNTPVPIPPPSNPLPIPSKTTVPIVPPPSNPLYMPSQDSIPIPYDNPLPTRQEEVLPIPPRSSGSGSGSRSSSPRSGRYTEAPVPAGVIYPEPLSRRGTPGLGRVGSPASWRRGARFDVRSPASQALSPLSLSFFAPLRSEGTAASVES
ncbi:hypothetical protein C8Q74DRAFT_1318193 [Fomes fomentarius]|nr:hypothetical protein C8Q74DRAFT_1318193 [Fomes fomentarius]